MCIRDRFRQGLETAKAEGREMKTLKCCRCDAEIRPGDQYSVILGEIYCKDHEEEYLKDELEARFDELREQLEEMVGIPVYYLEEL